MMAATIDKEVTMYLTPVTKRAWPLIESGELGALVTPQSHRPEQYDLGRSEYWAADNGCFTLGEKFDLEEFLTWLESFDYEARKRCLFATAPDVVGDWDATLERSLPVLEAIRERGFPAAIVIQDGATVDTVPWDRIDAVFVGGSTEWKLGPESAAITLEAERRNIWTHCGRVNSIKRARIAAANGCWSADGTMLLFGPEKNLPRLRRLVAEVSGEFGEVGIDDWNPYADFKGESQFDDWTFAQLRSRAVEDGFFASFASRGELVALMVAFDPNEITARESILRDRASAAGRKAAETRRG